MNAAVLKMADAPLHRLLVVDDDEELCAMLDEYLGPEGYFVSMVHDGASALATLASTSFDIVILDVMLPKLTGTDVLRELRKTSRVPVLMLTARGDDVDRIVGLELGADDYLPKPFNPRELSARLRAILRRTADSGNDDADELIIGDICIDADSRDVRIGERSIALTGAEFRLLEILARGGGDIVNKDQLYEQGLGRRYSPFDRSLDTHISNLRRKLGPAADGESRIASARGVGYQLRVPRKR